MTQTPSVSTRVKVAAGSSAAEGEVGESNPHARFRISAAQGMFLVVPVDAFRVPGSRRTAAKVCHRVKTVSSSRAYNT